MVALVGLPCGSDGKESACDAGDMSSTPGLGRCPGEENGDFFQYSCPEIFTDREPCWATVHGVAESDRTEKLTLAFVT